MKKITLITAILLGSIILINPVYGQDTKENEDKTEASEQKKRNREKRNSSEETKEGKEKSDKREENAAKSRNERAEKPKEKLVELGELIPTAKAKSKPGRTENETNLTENTTGEGNLPKIRKEKESKSLLGALEGNVVEKKESDLTENASKEKQKRPANLDKQKPNNNPTDGNPLKQTGKNKGNLSRTADSNKNLQTVRKGKKPKTDVSNQNKGSINEKLKNNKSKNTAKEKGNKKSSEKSKKSAKGKKRKPKGKRKKKN